MPVKANNTYELTKLPAGKLSSAVGWFRLLQLITRVMNSSKLNLLQMVTRKKAEIDYYEIFSTTARLSSLRI